MVKGSIVRNREKIVSVIAQLIYSITSFILALIAAKYLSIEAYSVLVVAMSWGLAVEGLFRFVCLTPLNVSNDSIEKRKEWAGKLIYGLLLAFSLIGVISLIMIMFGIIQLYDMYVMVLMSVFYCIFAAWRVWLNRYFSSSWVLFQNLMLFFVICFWAIGVELSLTSAQSLFTIILLLSLVLCSSFVFEFIRISGQCNYKNILKVGSRASLMGCFASIFYSAYNHLPLIILSFVLGPVAAGVFFIGRALTQPLMAILRGVELVYQRNLLNRINAHGYREIANSLMINSLLLCFIVALPSVFIGSVVLNEYYDGKYKIEYIDMIPWLFYSVLISLTKPVESIAFALNEQVKIIKTRGVAAIISIAFLYPLITLYGGVGAVYSVCLGWMVQLASMLYMLRNNAVNALN